MSAELSFTPSSRALNVGRRIGADQATAEVVSAMRRADIDSVVLKGPSVADWLYCKRGDRGYDDVDLLVSPAQLDGAGAVLRRLGFVERPPDIQGNRPLHARQWRRKRDHAVVDLHRSFPGLEHAERMWAALWAEGVTMTVAGQQIYVPSEAHRAMLLALHAAHHGRRSFQALRDLDRGLEAIECGIWRKAARSAMELGGADAFAAGLEVLPAGRVLLKEMGLVQASSVDSLLAFRESDEVTLSFALGIEWLRQAGGARERIKYVIRKLVPPRRWMKEHMPVATAGLPGLLAAYIWRLCWLVVRMPRGIIVWWLAFRSSSRRRKQTG